jgi:hypothetical protein
MKRLMVLALTLILVAPVLARAQGDDIDGESNAQYHDVDDGQLLKLVSYILAPFGMALEWVLMRPLHHAATQTAAAPLLSGDRGSPFFTNNDNASMVPPGTFAPTIINPTNEFERSKTSSENHVVTVTTARLKEESIPPSGPVSPGSQPALH